MNSFYILKKNVSFQNKVKKSTFIANLRFSDSQKNVKDIISEISKEHKNATHNCWAYILGKNAETFHFSDNGEPTGTAGKPILNALHKLCTTNITAVVTRYYGGVKLGVRGLIDAYHNTTLEALNNAELEKNISKYIINIIVKYDFLEILKYSLTKFYVTELDSEYSDVVNMKIEVTELFIQEIIKQLQDFKNSGNVIDFSHVSS